jgi:hypothetical protein
MADERMELYDRTIKRLARCGAKDPTSQIISLAEEIERYRSKIRSMELHIINLDAAGGGAKWIPVEERLPHEFVSVLVCIPCEHPLPTVQEAYLAGGVWVTRTAFFDGKDVTHWMQLPEPPAYKEG